MNNNRFVGLLVLAVAFWVGSMTLASAAGAEQGHSRLRGAALRPGDCIGVLAPSSWMERAEWEAGVRLLKEKGYRVKLARSCREAYGFFAGSDSHRAADVNRFFLDDEVDAILCLRGGYGAVRILDKLDYKEIARHPKLFIGYSDITALHTALGEKSGISTVHGAMLFGLGKESLPDYTREEFFRGITSDKPLGEISMPPGQKLETVTPGEAEGIVMGGNLTVLASMVGTPYELKGDGVLLFLEDVDETSYRLDRCLQQLWQSGLLHRVSGILYGDFLGGDDDLDEGDFTTDEVITYYAKLAGVPAIKGVPAGHAKLNAFLPFGVRARMKADKNGKASLVFEDPAVMPRKSEKTK